MIGVNHNTLQVLQDGLENTIFIHRFTVGFTLRRHCDHEPADKKEDFSEQKPLLDRKFKGNQRVKENNFVIEKLCNMLAPDPPPIYCAMVRVQ